jgi:hypothetical protein
MMNDFLNVTSPPWYFGYLAPLVIHSLINLICAAGNLPFGGICPELVIL